MTTFSDPFYALRDEVQQAIVGLSNVHKRWKDLLDTTNTATNIEFEETNKALKKGTKQIAKDLNRMEESIVIAKQNPSKHNLTPQELKSRKAIVDGFLAQIQPIVYDLSSTTTKAKMDRDKSEALMSRTNKPLTKYDKMKEAIERENDDYLSGQVQLHDQMMKDQDQDLEELEGVVGNLKDIGRTMDTAIKEQEALINSANDKADQANAGLKGAIKKVNELIDKSSDTCQYSVIAVLVVLLIILIVIVFYL